MLCSHCESCNNLIKRGKKIRRRDPKHIFHSKKIKCVTSISLILCKQINKIPNRSATNLIFQIYVMVNLMAETLNAEHWTTHKLITILFLFFEFKQINHQRKYPISIEAHFDHVCKWKYSRISFGYQGMHNVTDFCFSLF